MNVFFPAIKPFNKQFYVTFRYEPGEDVPEYFVLKEFQLDLTNVLSDDRINSPQELISWDVKLTIEEDDGPDVERLTYACKVRSIDNDLIAELVVNERGWRFA